MAEDILGSRHQRRIFEANKVRHAEKSRKAVVDSIARPDARLRLVVAGDTLLYRHLGQSLIVPADVALEIGSSYGHCTALLAATARRALGVDLSDEATEQARLNFPTVDFSCGDIFGDLAWLRAYGPEQVTALFADIGGNRGYRAVVDCLRVCLQLMPALRLIVVKSKELRSFLLRNEEGVGIMMRDLVCAPHQADVATALAREVRSRGGELPEHMVHLVNPNIRYKLGKGQLLPFVRSHPWFRVSEANYGPDLLRCRIHLADGLGEDLVRGLEARACLAPALAALALEVRRAFNAPGDEKLFQAVFSSVRRGHLSRYISMLPDTACYQQASDPTLDARAPLPWTESWQNVVAMRHLLAFLLASLEFTLEVGVMDSPLTVYELRRLRVVWHGPLQGTEELEPDGPELSRGTAGPHAALIDGLCDELQSSLAAFSATIGPVAPRVPFIETKVLHGAERSLTNLWLQVAEGFVQRDDSGEFKVDLNLEAEWATD